MANNKNYLEFLDIPDGSGGTERWHAKDAEAQASIAQVASAIGYDADYEFVDLGLPSGTLWAKCNVGATTETGYGNYYMYGKGATQYVNGDTPYAGTENPLAAAADTATQVMGDGWHMPTQAQVQELFDNTTSTWETNFNGSGVNGRKYTAANGNYIFIPAAGYYYNGSKSSENTACGNWTSSPAQQNGEARFLYANANNQGFGNDAYKSGRSVRGVMDSNPYDITKKADKSELPTYATPAECRAIVTGYTPSE
jgi:uncharacterized protein (TIGR02145 family)